MILEVPGATKEDLEVSPGPTQGTLAVRVSGRNASQPKNATLLRGERQVRDGVVAFARVIPVAWDADVAKASPRLNAGLLDVTVPKATPSAAPKRNVNDRQEDASSSGGKKNKS